MKRTISNRWIRRTFCLWGGIAFAGGGLTPARAEEAASIDPDHLAFFESRIRPALVEHCYKCHSQDAEKIKGGLLLDTREGALRGGDSGHAVVPGSLEESLLVAAIRYENEDLEMPPKYELPEEVVADFEKWILMGAPDPRGGEALVVSGSINIEQGREFWAYQPPRKPEPPKVDNSAWPRTEIDSFVLAKLEAEELRPVGDADRHALIRRVYFDLIGLPPTPEEVNAFIADEDPKAFENIVGRLLDSPQFGERWGRHWLDVARFGESSGKEANITFPHAWRYRDYVIDSFNADKPYDRFILEQIAGDLLAYETYREQADLLVATGFLALGPKSLNEANPRQFRADLVDEQIDTVSKAILGTTVACARCHDHKFDPIPTTDYYAMAGIFLSTDTYYGTVGTQGNRRPGDLLFLGGMSDEDLVQGALTPVEMRQMEARLNQVRAQQNQMLAASREARRRGGSGEPQNINQFLRTRSTIAMLEARLDSVDENGNPIPYAMGVWESDYPREGVVLERGEIDKPGQSVPRGLVQVLCKEGDQRIESKGSGRMELAAWLGSPENPLTARVMVNRIWHYLFGLGIVGSVDNFGSTGDAPSHPELLDWLAVEFMENGWSIKEMIREIVLTRTYQLSSDHDETNYAADPGNVYLWRMSKRRLEAEALRDAMLAMSGNLDLDPPRGSLVARAGDGYVGRGIGAESLESRSGHRSVYLPIVRDLLPDALDVFDFAEPSLVTGSRETTNVPSQALYLMNSEFVQQQAEGMAQRLLADDENGPERLKHAFLLAFSRPPSEEEGRKTKAYFDRFVATAMEEGLSRQEAGYLAMTSYCQALLAGAEFRFLN